MKKVFYFFSLFFLLTFVSCNNLLSTKKTASINLTLPAINDIYRSSDDDSEYPYFEDPKNVYYKVNIDSPENNYKYSCELLPLDTLTIVDLEPGEYNIYVEYESALNHFKGNKTVTLVEGEVTKAIIDLRDQIPTSEPHISYSFDDQKGIIFKIKTIDTDKNWGIPHLYNENYQLAILASTDVSEEYIYTFPFCKKGKRYVFKFGRDDGNGWEETKFAVNYTGETTDYKINTEIVNQYLNNFKTEIITDNDKYILSVDGVDNNKYTSIFDGINYTEYNVYLNYQLWSGKDKNSLEWIAESNMDLPTALTSPDLTSFIENNYAIIKDNNYNQIWTYIFFTPTQNFNQLFRLTDKFSNSFELNKPKYAESEHFKVEYDEEGIKVTLKSCENGVYAHQGDDVGDLRVCDFNTNFYSVVLNDEAIDKLNSNKEVSFIWPFANKDEYIQLELQYFLQTDNNHECKKENLFVTSGQGKYYSNPNYNNWDLFEIVNNDEGINSQRFIKSKVTYDQLMKKLPENAENIYADFVIEGTKSENPWNWDDRKWIVSFGGSFDLINKYDVDSIEKAIKENDYNFLISKLFTDEGLDIADLHNYYLWKNGNRIFDELDGYEYIIPTIDISFNVSDDELTDYVTYSTVFQCGDVKKESLKHQNVFFIQSDDNLKIQIDTTNINTLELNYIRPTDEEFFSYNYDKNYHTVYDDNFIEFEWPFGLEKDTDNVITIEGNKVDGSYFNEQQKIIVNNEILPIYNHDQWGNNVTPINEYNEIQIPIIKESYGEGKLGNMSKCTYEEDRVYYEDIDFIYVFQIWTKNWENSLKIYLKKCDYDSISVKKYSENYDFSNESLTDKSIEYIKNNLSDYNNTFDIIYSKDEIFSTLNMSISPDNLIGEFRYGIFGD